MNIQLQFQYRSRISTIRESPLPIKIKILIIEGLIAQIRHLHELARSRDMPKTRPNYEVLSTSISECPSMSYLNEKDIQQLQQKIIKMRMVKFQNNEDIETYEEELFEMEKVVKARMEYNQFLKKKVDNIMQTIHAGSGQKVQKGKQKSVLNKSIDTVAGILKISKWWS